MVETKLVAVRAVRHRLAAEVEQLWVAGWPVYIKRTSPPSAGDRLPLRRPGPPARGRAGAWASKGAEPAGGQGRPAARPARRHDHPGGVTQRWHGRRAVCSRPTPRWSAARRPARSSPRMRPAGASAAGAAPRTAGRRLCRVARPDRGRKRDRRRHRTRGSFVKRRLMEATRTRLHRARQTPYPPGRAVTGPNSSDPASDLKQEGCDQHGCGHCRELVRRAGNGWCARAIDAIRQRRTSVVPRERGVTAQQTNRR
jgi:hypothetical protein